MNIILQGLGDDGNLLTQGLGESGTPVAAPQVVIVPDDGPAYWFGTYWAGTLWLDAHWLGRDPSGLEAGFPSDDLTWSKPAVPLRFAKTAPLLVWSNH